MYKQRTSFKFNLKARLWPAVMAVINVFNNYYLRFYWVFNNKALTCVYSFLTSNLPELYRFWFAGFIILAGRDSYLYNAQLKALHPLDTRMEIPHSFLLVYSSFSTAGHTVSCGFLTRRNEMGHSARKLSHGAFKRLTYRRRLEAQTKLQAFMSCDICSG